MRPTRPIAPSPTATPRSVAPGGMYGTGRSLVIEARAGLIRRPEVDAGQIQPRCRRPGAVAEGCAQRLRPVEGDADVGGQRGEAGALVERRLCFRPIRDVLRGDERRAPSGKRQRVRCDFHIDDPARLQPMPPPGGMRPRSTVGGNPRRQPGHIVSGADFGQPHPQELGAGVSVRTDGGFVDLEEFERLEIVDPHRLRVLVEEQAVALFRLAQILLGPIAFVLSRAQL